jgi:hypothetical protein
MDYQEKKELLENIKSAKTEANKALSLVEAMTRKHAEQDGKLAALNERITRLEKILKVDIEAHENGVLLLPNPNKKGVISRWLGR